MNKLLVAITLAATAAVIVPANAEPRRNVVPHAGKVQVFAGSPGQALQAGNQCWRHTDSGRGYGYWTGCDQVYASARGRAAISINREAIGAFARADRTTDRQSLGAVARGPVGLTPVGLTRNAEIETVGGSDGGGGDGGGGGGAR